jgi:hypothetical protein
LLEETFFPAYYFKGTFSKRTNSQIQPSFHSCDSHYSTAFINAALIGAALMACFHFKGQRRMDLSTAASVQIID